MLLIRKRQSHFWDGYRVPTPHEKALYGFRGASEGLRGAAFLQGAEGPTWAAPNDPSPVGRVSSRPSRWQSPRQAAASSPVGAVLAVVREDAEVAPAGQLDLVGRC